MRFDLDYEQTHQRRGCIFILITALARVAGLITLAMLIFGTYLEWSAGESKNFRIYITVVTIIVGYLELLWILDKCVTCCICCFRDEICLYWACCIPIDNWLKTILYSTLSIPFLIPTWFLAFIRMDTFLTGILLNITGLLYLIKTFKYKQIDSNAFQEDDNISDASNAIIRPSIATQTSSIGINNDNLSMASAVQQEANLKN